MKKFLVLCVTLVLVIMLSRFCDAAPAYGTHMPEERHWVWGLEGSFIVDRNLDNDQGGVSGDRYFLTASYAVFPRLCFDGKIGVGDVDWHRNGAANLDFGTGFSGGYGFRVKAYENEEWGIKSVVGFQHISVHPPSENQAGNKHEAIVDEWQGSMVISKDIWDLVPYLGARYGTADYIKWVDEKDRKRIQSEEYCGVVIGLDYWLNNSTKINLEGAFVDGQEFAIGVSRDF